MSEYESDAQPDAIDGEAIDREDADIRTIPNALSGTGNGIEVAAVRGIRHIRIIGADGQPKSEWADIDLADWEPETPIELPTLTGTPITISNPGYSAGIATRIYQPTEDWAGIGRKHWMIAVIDSDPPRSGVGDTIEEAWADLGRRP